MNRFLCVWLPNWPIHRLVVEQPGLGHQPIVLHARDSRRGQRVVACSSSAKSLGVRVDMPLADAMVLGDGRKFHTHPHDPDADAQKLTSLAAWCHRFSPVVAIDLPDSLLFDLKGVTHLYGNEPKMTDPILREFQAKGYRPRIAIADTPAAAWAAAHYSRHVTTIIPPTEKFENPEAEGPPTNTSTKNLSHSKRPNPLSSLPVAALRIPDAALKKLERLGIHRIGQLAELPRENLPSRIGREVLERLDCLTGDKIETVNGDRPPPVFEQQWLLDRATDHWGTIQHIVQVLLERLASQLNCYGHGAIRLTVHFDCTAGQPVRIETGLYHSSADACHLNRLVQMQMEQAHLAPGGFSGTARKELCRKKVTRPFFNTVECVTVTADETVPLEQVQQSLLETENMSDPHEVAGLIERLSSRLGPNHVARAVPVDDWQPEKAFTYRAVLEKVASATARTGRERTPPQSFNATGFFISRPLRMFYPPKPVHATAKIPGGPPTCFYFCGEQRVISCSGPERIETAWWRGPCVKRDYYRVETESASRYWLFRCLKDNQWFLHGSFD